MRESLRIETDRKSLGDPIANLTIIVSTENEFSQTRDSFQKIADVCLIPALKFSYSEIKGDWHLTDTGLLIRDHIQGLPFVEDQYGDNLIFQCERGKMLYADYLVTKGWLRLRLDFETVMQINLLKTAFEGYEPYYSCYSPVLENKIMTFRDELKAYPGQFYLKNRRLEYLASHQR